MIKNIIFDLGNVLINYDFEIFFHKLGYQTGERHLKEAHSIIHAFECGMIEIDHFLSELQKIYDSQLDPEQFRLAWCDVFWENEAILSTVNILKEKYRLMILSNNDELHFPYIWNKFPALHVFPLQDIMITSRLGYVKPDIRVYQKAERIHEFLWEEALFIDDVRINTQIAAGLGASTIWHQNNDATLFELKTLLS